MADTPWNPTFESSSEEHGCASTLWHGYREEQTPLHGQRASRWLGTAENNVVPLQTTVTSAWDPCLCRQPSGMKATPRQDTHPKLPMLRIYKQPKELDRGYGV